MKSPKILVYSPQAKEVEKYVEILRSHGCTQVAAASTPEEAERHLPETEVLLCWKFPIQLLPSPAAANVRWVQSMGAGVDDWVSAGEVPSRIVITRILDQFGGPIAEYVFAYLLSLAKDLPRLRTAQSERRWEPFVTGFLQNKTIGVAGLGSIGAEIVRKARAFDMKVAGLSHSGRQAHLVDRHFGPHEWSSFVQELDYLVLTLPLTKETHHVVDRQVLLAMKPDACLVNVGRGSLIAEADLIGVLHSGHLQAAVLDVFEQEPLLADSPLWNMPNVFVTPHLSGPSTPEDVGRFFLQNLERYVQGKPLAGAVNRELGY
ncbi:D-2-hydroxyacid dehydrogenase [Brevibacillus massiliensis]|uniref:D-2-hydroxyacid dehydrogenase n=1 Tax=Brevibacillus massiliensis TaxID=1118054 RepID=UPI0002E916E1|nr:D-2-hydroxyacid dehydrogenase [Brevibacillus massiliensis]